MHTATGIGREMRDELDWIHLLCKCFLRCGFAIYCVGQVQVRLHGTGRRAQHQERQVKPVPEAEDGGQQAPSAAQVSQAGQDCSVTDVQWWILMCSFGVYGPPNPCRWTNNSPHPNVLGVSKSICTNLSLLPLFLLRSGTPVQNNLGELLALLSFLMPAIFRTDVMETLAEFLADGESASSSSSASAVQVSMLCHERLRWAMRFVASTIVSMSILRVSSVVLANLKAWVSSPRSHT